MISIPVSKSSDTYPYQDGIMKAFAVIYVTQKVLGKEIDILDPIGLTLRTNYYESMAEVRMHFADMMNAGEKVRTYNVFATGLCIDTDRWVKLQ